jgi:SEC-C motif-containing protein
MLLGIQRMRTKGDMVSSWPKSAKALLEARYQAFVSGNVDFIIESHHPESRANLDRNSLEAWSKESQWGGLTIEEVEEGKEVTFITFTVRYTRGAETVNHRERAEFKLVDGKWHYFDSEFPKPKTLKRDPELVGRNEPCPCGSGKKYKKCHLAAA